MFNLLTMRIKAFLIDVTISLAPSYAVYVYLNLTKLELFLYAFLFNYVMITTLSYLLIGNQTLGEKTCLICVNQKNMNNKLLLIIRNLFVVVIITGAFFSLIVLVFLVIESIRYFLSKNYSVAIWDLIFQTKVESIATQ